MKIKKLSKIDEKMYMQFVKAFEQAVQNNSFKFDL